MDSIKVRNLDIGAGDSENMRSDRRELTELRSWMQRSVSPDPRRIWQSGAQTGMKMYSMNRKPGRC